MKNIETGCIASSSKGIYLGAYVIRLAISKGLTFDDRFNQTDHYPDSYLSELDDYSDLWSRAESFLNSSDIVPDGHFYGISKDGDFGLWPTLDYLTAKAARKALKALENLCEVGNINYWNHRLMYEMQNDLKGCIVCTGLDEHDFSKDIQETKRTIPRTIDINAKEWFDSVNGNSYFDCTVITDYQLPTERRFVLPFQYGYGNSYEDAAFKCLNAEFPDLPKKQWELKDVGVVLRTDKIENCKKRELFDPTQKMMRKAEKEGWSYYPYYEPSKNK